ncbi:MAG TPA: hypothetical protein HPP80_05410 [Rhodospirillaceae bacterium]|nr:hypothetical protein [Rhodospirillaceae bacterium]
MLTRAEFFRALTGIGAILRFRPDAFGFFDTTLNGFWKSFWAAAFAAPVWLLLVIRHMSAAQSEAPLRYLSLQTIAYAISWLAFPLLMVRISRFLDRSERYFSYMVAYNWFQMAQSIAWIPVLFFADNANGTPSEAIRFLWLVINGALFAYGWFIARRGLQIPGGNALALVLIDFLLGLIIDGVTDSLAQ